MTDNSKRVSELPQSANAAQNDRVVFLKSPSSNASLRTITVANLTLSMTKATDLSVGVVRIGNNISVDSNGTISVSGTKAVPSTNIASVGYVLTTNSAGGSQWKKFTGVNQVTSIDNGAATYTAVYDDSVILVNPAVVGSNVTITLPIASAIEGKEILIKNIDASTGKKVTVTTDDIGNEYLEDPVTGAFVTGYDLIETGQAETWIHDGNVYRHLNTARATPIFYTSANTYTQVVVTNISNGQNASADLVFYNDLGDYEAGTGPFLDVGIESSTYSNSLYTMFGPNDAYVYTGNANILIGTDTNKAIKFFANGTLANNLVLTVNSSSITTNVATVYSSKKYTTAGTLDLSKTVQTINAAGTYILNDGYEGQVMHIVGTGDSLNGIYINMKARKNNANNAQILTPGYWGPFWTGTNGIPARTLATTVFTDGAWSVDGEYWD